MEYKQVILVRADLAMSRGKTCAQVAHASLSSADKAREFNKEEYKEWKREGQKKVVLKVASEKELFELFEMAKGQSMPCYIINDSGLTELPPGTTTALGIGPSTDGLLDKITGHLKLLK
ncbi:MAG: peptidyl-tRNA hydrolase Pth2 [Candidatus Hydrothermarchaeaceae archaeon]